VYPRFSGLVRSGDVERLGQAYRLSLRLLGTILFPIAMLFSVFPGELIQAWTGDSGLVRGAGPLLPILAIGTALHGVMYVPFALQLAYGTTKLPLTINGIQLAVITPLAIFLVHTYGAAGAALAWLALHSMYVLLGIWLTHRQLLTGLKLRWIALDIGVPLATSVLVGLLARYSSATGDLGVHARLACGAGWTLAAFALAFATSPDLRVAARQRFRGMAYRTP
jgi:O-antigen/teichoic acid export membrane protein